MVRSSGSCLKGKKYEADYEVRAKYPISGRLVFELAFTFIVVIFTIGVLAWASTLKSNDNKSTVFRAKTINDDSACTLIPEVVENSGKGVTTRTIQGDFFTFKHEIRSVVEHKIFLGNKVGDMVPELPLRHYRHKLLIPRFEDGSLEAMRIHDEFGSFLRPTVPEEEFKFTYINEFLFEKPLTISSLLEIRMNCKCDAALNLYNMILEPARSNRTQPSLPMELRFLDLGLDQTSAALSILYNGTKSECNCSSNLYELNLKREDIGEVPRTFLYNVNDSLFPYKGWNDIANNFEFQYNCEVDLGLTTVQLVSIWVPLVISGFITLITIKDMVVSKVAVRDKDHVKRISHLALKKLE
eukprot:CAMPEP_0167743028 /NCGR_PEP_ID=MMETSP0110_2-20121227/1779_1 /TAXON_ID=629695 /ORGANISM="Gymnochlora sp., Strain CCMP2014" /LENGTH=354 /DNA_ID=CAMNT_0007627335 /DNA_START=1 /DNA_END=1065 /DNA_ORIENTATION=+